jgi:hypothetical protein
VLLPANQGLNRPLAALVRWWIQRQVTQVAEINIVLQGASQVWRSGCLSYVQVFAQKIIYQNIHLEQVDLIAQDMRFHLPFLQRKGEPFLEPITVQIQAVITEENVHHSLPYLQESLRPYLQKLDSEITKIENIKIHPYGIDWLTNKGAEYATQINLISPNQLTLVSACESHSQVLINLGTDVQIQELKLEPAAIKLSGNLIIRPGAPAG